MTTDILVIGSGLAGCAAALAAAKRNAEVTLLTRCSQPEESNTLWAHGGIIYEGENDSPRWRSKARLEPRVPPGKAPRRTRG